MANVNFNLSELIQKVINNNEDLLSNFSTGNKIFDFTPGDFVKCTILQGHYRVLSINGSGILIQEIRNSGDTKLIDPNFLHKSDLTEKWVKILYEAQKKI